MKNICIDIGNSSIKYGVFEDNFLILDAFFEHKDFTIFFNEILKYQHDYNLIISNVSNIDNSFLNQLNFKEKLILDYELNLPIKVLYNTPKTLGSDRIAISVAVSSKYEKKNILAIDFGTFIKYEWITKNNEYLGGLISNGLNFRYNNYIEKGAKLKNIDINFLNPNFGNFGKTTEESIRYSIFNSLKFELNGNINNFLENYQDGLIISNFNISRYLNFETNKKFVIFPNFVLYGLNNILTFNLKK